MITRAEAKAKIAQIQATQTPIKTGITLPIRKGDTFKVWRIPLALLIPNVFNDRITWKIREYEAENDRALDMESDDDIELLYSMIMQEHPADNEKTKADLAKNGQQVDGVITNDGRIVDGNRRATLLRALFNGEADKYGQNVEDIIVKSHIGMAGSVSLMWILAN